MRNYNVQRKTVLNGGLAENNSVCKLFLKRGFNYLMKLYKDLKISVKIITFKKMFNRL